MSITVASNIMVGDSVRRNDTLAIYDEDVCPEDMDFKQVYIVKTIYNRKYTLMGVLPVNYQTAELEGLEGEVNLDLIDKVKEN